MLRFHDGAGRTDGGGTACNEAAPHEGVVTQVPSDSRNFSRPSSIKRKEAGDSGPRPAGRAWFRPQGCHGSTVVSRIGTPCTCRLAPCVADLLDFCREFQGAGLTGSRPIPAIRF
jgi:hypothetical protein